MTRENHVMLQASYIVYKDDNDIKAKNGLTGNTDFSGTDAYTVIQNIINTLSPGQTLYIKSGLYILTNTLTVNKPINIKGEGAVIEKMGQPGFVLAGTVLQRAGNILDITMTNNNLYNNMSDILFDGVDRSGTVINLNKFHGSLKNVYVVRGNIGIKMMDSWTSSFYSVHAQFCNYGLNTQISGNNALQFFGCQFSNNRIMGTYLERGAQIGFFGCNFESNGKYGVSIDNGARNVSFTGCYFENNPNYADYAYSTTGADVMLGETVSNPPYVTAIAINGCNFTVQDNNVNITAAPRIKIGYAYGILIAACIFDNGDNTIRPDITNNGVYDPYITIENSVQITGGNGIWLIDGTRGMNGIKSINTKGLITQNNTISSSFAIDSTGIKTVTIAHGLAITPTVQDCCLTVIQDTAVDDWAYNVLKVIATDATNVTAKINISVASLTIDATARLALRV